MESNLGYIIAGAVLILLVGFFLMIRYFTKKFGTEKVTSVLSDIKDGLNKVDIALDAMGPIIPNSTMNVADTILKWAYIAVNAVERMYLSGVIKKEERKDLAIEKTAQVLNLIGIDVTPEINDVIGTSLESAVNALPKTHPVVIQKKTK